VQIGGRISISHTRMVVLKMTRTTSSRQASDTKQAAAFCTDIPSFATTPPSVLFPKLYLPRDQRNAPMYHFHTTTGISQLTAWRHRPHTHTHTASSCCWLSSMAPTLHYPCCLLFS